MLIKLAPIVWSLLIFEFLSYKLTDSSEKLKLDKAEYLYFQAVIQLDISATAIRYKIEKSMGPSFLLPENVIEYI